MLRPDDHIVFIGDSITHAHRRPEEHHDCYYLGCGYVKMVAAALNLDRPDLRVKITNRGECGHTTTELLQRWDTDSLALKPTVISILIGINDAARNSSADDFRSRYQQLIDRSRAAIGNVRLVLLEPFALKVDAEGVPVTVIEAKQLQAVQPLQPVVAELARANGAAFVPLQKSFDRAAGRSSTRALALDGIHPSAAGQALIAREWLKVVLSAS